MPLKKLLDQKVRPGIAPWHPRRVAGQLDAAARPCFRAGLRDLQRDLRHYPRLLADMAAVEDLTALTSV